MVVVVKDRCLGRLPWHSGAAIMGILQTVLVILLLSTTGVLLNRWHSWRSETEVHRARDTSDDGTTYATSTRFPGGPNVQVSPLTTTTQVSHPAALAVWPDDGKWYRDSALSAFLEIHLTHHVALYCLWLICLAIFGLSFRYRRPALVIPNLVMQIIGLILMMILIGIVIAKLVVLNYEYDSIVTTPRQRNTNAYPGSVTFDRDDLNMRYAFYAILLGILVIAVLAQLVFIWIAIDYYKYLRDREHTLYPEGYPEGHVTSYHHHQEHTLLRDEDSPKRTTTHHVTATSVQPVGTKIYSDQPVTKTYTEKDYKAVH